MKNFFSAIAVIAMGAFLASCDLQPKIASIPDVIGDFIYERYPAMLADPDKEPEIYNSAVSDYGVYASPELYGSVDMDEYVNYANIDDYTMPAEPGPEPAQPESEHETESVEPEIVPDTGTAHPQEPKPEPEDVLDVPEYQNDELVVPARATAGTVIVRRGDTLYAIARENNTTIDALAAENNLKSPYSLRIGQTLKLPQKPVEQKPVVAKSEPKPELKNELKPEPKPESKPEAKSVSQPAIKSASAKSENVRVPLKTITVARGDTLYSLSRTYAVPVNDLAVMNDLRAPFALNTGQTLRVPDLPTVKPDVKKVETKKTESVPYKKAEVKESKKVEPKPDVKKVETKTVKVETKPVTPKQTKPEETKTNQQTKNSTKKTQTKAVTKPAEKTTPKIAARSSNKFTWPVRGTVLSHYGAKTGGLYNDGINISATLGTSVVAAENGVVAYAGNEVRGMGNLVIIQHADGFMTVYAHMASMAVRRGTNVTVGQKIGTVGQTGKVTKPQLHFEIRKGTKSYNPANYLKK